MIEWNVAQATQGSAGMWDVHVRIGGSAGTELQSDKCSKNPSVIAAPNPACEGAFMMFHVTKTGSVYLENTWFWVSDHELDLKDHNQINIFSGRGVSIESTVGPVWMWGTASEHSVLYNYQITNAASVFMGLIQTETPYYQSNPNALVPFTMNTAFNDPNFSATCGSDTTLCPKSWGLRVVNSKDIHVFGAGLYSFFENYDQDCVDGQNCQTNMVSLETSSNIFLYGLSTKAAINMVTLDGKSAALDKDNRNNFCAAIAFFDVDGGAGTAVTTGDTTTSPAAAASTTTPAGNASPSTTTAAPSADSTEAPASDEEGSGSGDTDFSSVVLPDAPTPAATAVATGGSSSGGSGGTPAKPSVTPVAQAAGAVTVTVTVYPSATCT